MGPSCNKVWNPYGMEPIRCGTQVWSLTASSNPFCPDSGEAIRPLVEDTSDGENVCGPSWPPLLPPVGRSGDPSPQPQSSALGCVAVGFCLPGCRACL